jgi:hypothetical protein
MMATTEGQQTMERNRLRALTSAWQRLCDCFGPQPDLNKLNAEGHNGICPFRKFVESDNGERKEGESCREFQ